MCLIRLTRGWYMLVLIDIFGLRLTWGRRVQLSGRVFGSKSKCFRFKSLLYVALYIIVLSLQICGLWSDRHLIICDWQVYLDRQVWCDWQLWFDWQVLLLPLQQVCPLGAGTAEALPVPETLPSPVVPAQTSSLGLRRAKVKGHVNKHHQSGSDTLHFLI